jgi:hypothetical protein
MKELREKLEEIEGGSDKVAGLEKALGDNAKAMAELKADNRAVEEERNKAKAVLHAMLADPRTAGLELATVYRDPRKLLGRLKQSRGLVARMRTYFLGSSPGDSGDVRV